MMARAKFDPLPPGLATLGLGLGVVAITFASLAADDVSYARTQWLALLALILASPAIILYGLRGNTVGMWWRCFWTVGLLAYLLHFWWSIFRSYNGDLDAIVERQGWVAYSNYLVTALWIGDVVAAWVVREPNTAVTGLRFVAWLGVGVSFIVASAVFRTGSIRLAGYGLLAAVGAAVLVRAFGISFEPVEDGGGST